MYLNRKIVTLLTRRETVFRSVTPHYLRYSAKRFIASSRGVISVEMALVAPVFIILAAFVFSLCRMFYLVAAIDLAVVEAGKIASVADNNYETVFKETLESTGTPWVWFVNGDNATLNVQYCESIDQAISEQCVSNPVSPRLYPLAIYEIRYKYLPELFSSVLPTDIVVRDVYVQGDKIHE